MSSAVLRIMVMSPRAQVVTRGLFLMVVSSQDMMWVAGNGDKQLVICGSSEGLSCREVIRQVTATFSLPTNLSRRDLSSAEAKPHQAGEVYSSEATVVALATRCNCGGRRP